MGLCLQSANFKEAWILVPFMLGTWTLWYQLCVSGVSPCEEEYYFHDTFRPLASWPCECFVRTRKRLSWFLEGRYQGWAWLGDWKWCQVQQYELLLLLNSRYAGIKATRCSSLQIRGVIVTCCLWHGIKSLIETVWVTVQGKSQWLEF